MRTVEQITDTARARYRTSWRDWLANPPTRPIDLSLNPPTRETVIAQHERVDSWLKTWHTFARDNPGLRLRHTTRTTPFGKVEIATHLQFPTPAAVAALNPEDHTHWLTATRRYAQLQDRQTTPERLLPLLPRIIQLTDTDFELLLTVVDWFARNPASGYTIRQVPVPGLHTKWLAKNRRLVTGLLPPGGHADIPDQGADDDPVSEELSEDLLDALGLLPLPIEIDIALPDPTDRALLHGLRHLRGPVEDIARLPLRPGRVLIVENKQSAFPIPDTPSLVVIHSLGNNLDVLTRIPWLAQASVYYWGDLDRAGLTLLSRARTRLPALISVLMDEETLRLHEPLTNPDPTKADKPDSTLTPDELATLAQLSAPPRRLEQERLPWNYVQDRLTEQGITSGLG